MDATGPLASAHKNCHPIKDTKNQRMTGYVVPHREGEAETQGRQRDQRRVHPQEPTGTWAQTGVGKGGMTGRGTQRQKQACNTGRRYEQRRLEGGGKVKV